MGVRLIPKKVMNRVVARHTEVQTRLASEAEAIGSRAEANLSAHRDTGSTEIRVEHPLAGKRYGSIDHFIVMQDESDENAANAIEFGHKGRNGKPVSGLYVLTRAAGLV